MAAGSIVGASVEDIPADRRFYAGGGGSVRGYEYQGIGPKDPEGNPIGGRSYMELSGELRMQVTETIGIVPFVDAGTVSEDEFLGSARFQVGAGVGLRYLTPFGPLRIDAAVPLNRRARRSELRHLCRRRPGVLSDAATSRLVLRILRYTIYAALAFVIAALAVLTLTERGRDNLAGLISDFASSPGRTVKIAGIDGIWSGNLTLQSLVLEDEDGPWLVARNIAVDWSPLTLFSATFQADRIFAERIEVARLPKPASEPKEEAGSFSLPVSIDLKQIDLPDIALGPALAGGVASVAAKGSARAEASPLQIVSQLNIARSDGRAGNIDASIDFAPADNRLDIDIRASEPQGGIIANLLKLPGEPPVEINVSGSGPAADWSGSGTFAVDGTVVTRVEGRHQFTDKGSAIEAKGDGDFERFVPEDLRPLLSGNSSFDFAGIADLGGRRRHRARDDREQCGEGHGVRHARPGRRQRLRAAGRCGGRGRAAFLRHRGQPDRHGGAIGLDPGDRRRARAEPRHRGIAVQGRDQRCRARRSGDRAAFGCVQHQEPQRPGDRYGDCGGADHRQSDDRAAGRRQDQRRALPAR